MNKKNICRLLSHVHQEWAASITDDNVKKLVLENTIISGGAIASLLLSEKVNDFDVYFTDFDTAKAVAEYYIKQFIALNPKTKIRPKLMPHDLEAKRVKIYVKSVGFCSEAGDDKYQYFEQAPDNEGEEYIDHGIAPIEDDGDITTPMEFQRAISEADEIPDTALNKESTDDSSDKQNSKPKYRPIFMTSNAITLSNDIQVVVRFYGTPNQIHENYDFTHCTNYWMSKNVDVCSFGEGKPCGTLVLRPEALEALLARELRYQGSKYPVCSVIRTRKFLKRGWIINAGQYLKMMFQISELDLTKMDVLEDQLTGVDTAYFMQLIMRCKADMKHDTALKIDSTYIVSLVDRMFS